MRYTELEEKQKKEIERLRKAELRSRTGISGCMGYIEEIYDLLKDVTSGNISHRIPTIRKKSEDLMKYICRYNRLNEAMQQALKVK